MEQYVKEARLISKFVFKPTKLSVFGILICFALQFFGCTGFFFVECLKENARYANSYLNKNSVYVREYYPESKVFNDPLFLGNELNNVQISTGKKFLFDLAGNKGSGNYSVFQYDDYELTKVIGNKKIIYGDTSSLIIFDKMCDTLFGITDKDYSSAVGKTVSIYYRNEYVMEMRVSGVFVEKSTAGLLSPVYSGNVLSSYVFCSKSVSEQLTPFQAVNCYSMISTKEYDKKVEDNVVSVCTKHGADYVSFHTRYNSIISRYHSLFTMLNTFSIVAILFSLIVQISIHLALLSKKEEEIRIISIYTLRENVSLLLRFCFVLAFIIIPIAFNVILLNLIKFMLANFIGFSFISGPLFIVSISFIAILPFSLGLSKNSFK